MSVGLPTVSAGHISTAKKSVAGLKAYKAEKLAGMIVDGGRPWTDEELASAIKVTVDDLATIKADPEFSLLVQAKIQGRLVANLCPAAIDIMLEVLTERNAQNEYKYDVRYRLKAAEMVLNKTIVPPAPAEQTAKAEQDLAEMSVEALHSLIDGLESELAARARPVAPGGEPGSQASAPSDLNSCLD